MSSYRPDQFSQVAINFTFDNFVLLSKVYRTITMTFQQLILVAMTLGIISTASEVTAASQGRDAAPVRKRTHLRHLSSNVHANSEEHEEIYDPFIGIPRGLEVQAGSMPMSMSIPSKLRTNRVMSMPSSMSMELQAAPSFTSCPLDCGTGQICAFSSPESEPFCYPECLPSFPVFSAGDGECRLGDVCIHR